MLAVKSYFDGSISPKRIALAGIVADSDTWAELEGQWEQVRKSRGNPAYIHMTYLMGLRDIYKNWSEDDRDYLVDGLLNVLLFFRGKPTLRRFTCSVDRTAYEHYKSIQRLPSPERLCARMVFPHVMESYAQIPGVHIGEMQVYFDRNEPFMRHIQQDWTSKQIRKKHPQWRLVSSIIETEMQRTPALQIADMVAWGCNRIDSGSHWETDPHYIPAKRAFGALQGIHRPCNAEAIAKFNYREEGYAAIDRQRRAKEFDLSNTSQEFKKFDRMMRELMLTRKGNTSKKS